MNASLSYSLLNAAANKFGTPLYVYHAEKIEQQYQNLLAQFESTQTNFFYACKALTNVHILKVIKEMGCNIDCSSINEVKLALHVGFFPHHILYTSNSVDFDEISTAVELGVNVNIDSLSNLEKFGQKFGGTKSIGVRIRPDVMAGGNLKISTGHIKSKFGIPLTQLDALKSLQEKYKIHIRTLHIHTGSEIKDVAVFMKSAEVFDTLLPHFPSVEVLDFGGGFKVPYAPGEQGTDMALLGAEVNKVMKQLSEKFGRNFTAWFEPGKYMVSEAGFFIAKVNVLKTSGEVIFAGLNTGLNHLIRPMLYNGYHHITNISNPDGPLRLYTVVGYICETDTFGWDRKLNEVREGDILAFSNAGAYGMTMSSNYNSRFRPAEVFVYNGKAELIRKRENLDDILRNQVFD